MKTAKSLAILALAVPAAHPLSADTLAVAQYAKSMNVVFAGVQDGVVLTNFPALVRLSPSVSGFNYADFARVNGGDLRADELTAKHADWAEGFRDKYEITAENAMEIVKQETGLVFAEVLEHAGVFKRNEQGREAFLRFTGSVM